MQALLDAGFTVTAITRIESTSSVLPGAKVHKTDYSSPESILEAFKGQDAVVSTIATAALGQQQAIVDAAVKAGVKRFIPSEFGMDTTTIEGGAKKILGGKIALQDVLSKAAKENEGFSWTGISTGMFFDWVCTLSDHSEQQLMETLLGPQSRITWLFTSDKDCNNLGFRK